MRVWNMEIGMEMVDNLKEFFKRNLKRYKKNKYLEKEDTFDAFT